MDALPDELLAHCLARLSPPQQALAGLVCRRFHSVLSLHSVLQLRQWQGLLEPWLCVMGGVQEDHHQESMQVELYDFVADKWRLMLPSPPTITFDFCCAFVKGRLYQLGGIPAVKGDMISHMDVYNFRDKKWEKAKQMAELREAFACGVIKDQIYVAGGLVRQPFLQKTLRVRSAEVYNPETERWESIPPMRECRSSCASAVVGQKLYVIGGYGTDGILRSVEAFDPSHKTWAFRAPTPAPWTIAGCAAIGHLIYLVISPVLEEEETIAVYDTDNNKWHLKGAIPIQQLLKGSAGTLWGCAVLASKGKLFILGGASSYNSGLRSGLVYDPASETWSTFQMMRSPRYGCAGVVIHL